MTRCRGGDSLAATRVGGLRELGGRGSGGGSAGIFMAVAMASEMGFLGISFALALTHLPK